MPLGRVAEIWGADQKVVASRLCALRASTSAVRQADRLRGAAHPVVNIRTSEHHVPSRPRLSVRMFGSWGKKRERVLELRCPVAVPREIGFLVNIGLFGPHFKNNTSTCYRAGQFSLAQDAENFRAERIVPTPLPRKFRATTPTGIYDRPQVGLSVKHIIGFIDDQGRVFAINSYACWPQLCPTITGPHKCK